MKTYFIQYNTAEDSILVNRIKALGSWAQFFGKSWLVKSNLTSQQIYDQLSINHQQDSVFIIEVNQTNYWGRMNRDLWDWLQTNRNN